jgi:hypothetical protein
MCRSHELIDGPQSSAPKEEPLMFCLKSNAWFFFQKNKSPPRQVNHSVSHNFSQQSACLSISITWMIQAHSRVQYMLRNSKPCGMIVKLTAKPWYSFTFHSVTACLIAWVNVG